MSDAHLRRASPVASYMKLVLFSTSSLFKCGGRLRRGGSCASVFCEIGLPLPIIVNIIPPTSLPVAVALDGAVLDISAKTHPLGANYF